MLRTLLFSQEKEGITLDLFFWFQLYFLPGFVNVTSVDEALPRNQ